MTNTQALTVPSGFEFAVKHLLDAASQPKKHVITRSLALYRQHCDRETEALVFSTELIQSFEAWLLNSYSRIVANARLRVIRDIGVCGPDLALRDWLFNRFEDHRSQSEILEATWWPPIPRALAAAATFKEKRRVLQELDSFLRWKGRTNQDE